MNTYPPSHEECERLFHELTTLDTQHRNQYCARKYEIIHDLAEAKYYEARLYFINGLNHSDPDYRWACISALATHWQDDDQTIVVVLKNIASDDSDPQVRMLAIDSLANLNVRSAVPLLQRILQDSSQDPDILDTTRKALGKLETSG